MDGVQRRGLGERNRQTERKGAADKSSAEKLLVLTVNLGKQQYGGLNSDEAYHHVYIFLSG